jgi:hypothetical protein
MRAPTQIRPPCFLQAGDRKLKRSIAPKSKNLIVKPFQILYQRGFQRGLDSKPVKAGSQVTLPGVPRSPSDVTREPKL